MTESPFNALEHGLIELEQGTELDQVLKNANPSLANELEPALIASQYARSLAEDQVSSEILRRSRTLILSRAAQLRQEREPGVRPFQFLPRLVNAFLLTLIFLLVGSGFFAASAKALPGDQLYTAKRTLEELRLKVVLDPLRHREIEETFENRRIDELQKLLAAGREELVHFFGVVEQLNKDRWLIEGIEVLLTPDTIIIGDILPGMKVEVEGITLAEGFVLASEIHLQRFAFVGYVESMASDRWQVDGKTVLITTDTFLNPTIQVGDWVVVSVRSDDFGNLTARIIDKSNLPTPTPQLVVPTLTFSPTPDSPAETADFIEENESKLESDDTPAKDSETLQHDNMDKENDSSDTDEQQGCDADGNGNATPDDNPEDENDAEQENPGDDTSQPEDDDEHDDNDDDDPD